MRKILDFLASAALGSSIIYLVCSAIGLSGLLSAENALGILCFALLAFGLRVLAMGLKLGFGWHLLPVVLLVAGIGMLGLHLFGLVGTGVAWGLIVAGAVASMVYKQAETIRDAIEATDARR